MSRWQRSTYSLGVGLREMAVVDMSGQAAARLLSLLPLEAYLGGANAPENADWEPSMATVMAQTEVKTGVNLHVTIADDWVRYWLVAPPEGLRSLDEMRALAVSRFEQLYATSIDGWTLAADWSLKGASLVCALPSRLLASLQNVSAQYQWHIETIQPQAVRLMNGRRDRIGKHAWVCAFSTGTFLAVLLEDGVLRHARQFRFDSLPSVEDVCLRLETELLRIGCDVPPVALMLGRGPELRDLGNWHGMSLESLDDAGSRAVLTGSGKRSQAEACVLAMQGGLA